MQKNQLIELLDDKFEAVIEWVNTQPNNTFAIQKIPGKWSNGEHVEHLRKTARAVNKGMKIPKLILRYKFGKMNRPEKSYDTIKTRYIDKLKQTQVKAPDAVSPRNVTNADKERILQWFIQEKETMKGYINKNSDRALGKYVLPHPIIGKLSFREFIYFTALHTEHHLNLMKRYNS